MKRLITLVVLLMPLSAFAADPIPGCVGRVCGGAFDDATAAFRTKHDTVKNSIENVRATINVPGPIQPPVFEIPPIPAR